MAKQPTIQKGLISIERLGKIKNVTPMTPTTQPINDFRFPFCFNRNVCIIMIIIGPVADKTAAIPDVTYCSAQYNVANVPKVKPTPVKTSLYEITPVLSFFLSKP